MPLFEIIAWSLSVLMWVGSAAALCLMLQSHAHVMELRDEAQNAVEFALKHVQRAHDLLDDSGVPR